MGVDAAAERIYEEIKIYIAKYSSPELTYEEEKEFLVGVLKVIIEEIATIAVVGALEQTKIAVDLAIAANLKKRNEQNGHLR